MFSIFRKKKEDNVAYAEDSKKVEPWDINRTILTSTSTGWKLKTILKVFWIKFNKQESAANIAHRQVIERLEKKL